MYIYINVEMINKALETTQYLRLLSNLTLKSKIPNYKKTYFI